MCSDTQCSVNELPDHVEMLNQVTEGSSLLEKEFKVHFISCALIRETCSRSCVIVRIDFILNLCNILLTVFWQKIELANHILSVISNDLLYVCFNW